jgi:hypothetical protein
VEGLTAKGGSSRRADNNSNSHTSPPQPWSRVSAVDLEAHRSAQQTLVGTKRKRWGIRRIIPYREWLIGVASGASGILSTGSGIYHETSAIRWDLEAIVLGFFKIALFDNRPN